MRTKVKKSGKYGRVANMAVGYVKYIAIYIFIIYAI